MLIKFQTQLYLIIQVSLYNQKMKTHQNVNQLDMQKLIHFLEKTTESLLNIFSYYSITPSMIEVCSIIDYAKNLELMVQQLFRNLPKVCVSLQVFKKMQTQLQSKTQKIQKNLQYEKNLKIQLKVLEERNEELEMKLIEKETQAQRENQVPESLQKILKLEKEKQRERERQIRTNQISQRYIAEKIALGSQKKRLSLPYISSNSIHIPVSQKSILKPGRPSGSKPKNYPFATIPGQGSEILIQHLMKKASINK